MVLEMVSLKPLLFVRKKFRPYSSSFMYFFLYFFSNLSFLSLLWLFFITLYVTYSLKQRRSARKIQTFYRQRKHSSRLQPPDASASSSSSSYLLPGIHQSSLSLNRSGMASSQPLSSSVSLNHQTNNSLFVSVLPSTIENDDDALSVSSNSGLINLTFATEVSAISNGEGERSQNVTSSNILPSSSGIPQARVSQHHSSSSSQKPELLQQMYANVIDPNKLIDIQHTVMAKTLRKQQGIPEPLPSSSGKSSKENNNTVMNNLAQVRDRSDTLLYQHLRNRSKYGNTPEEIHNRRMKLIQKIETLTSRLERPAKPSDVLSRALARRTTTEPVSMTTDKDKPSLNTTQQSFTGLNSSDEDEESYRNHRQIRRQQSIQHDLRAKNIENIPPSIPTVYKEALGVIRWPSTMPDAEKIHIVQTHLAAMEALSPQRHWYDVYAANELQQSHSSSSSPSVIPPSSTGSATMDIREINPQPLWPWDNETMRTNPKLASLFATNPSQNGWKALTLQNYLPPKVKEAVPVCKLSPEDATSLALESHSLFTGSNSTVVPTPKSNENNPVSSPAVYAFQQGKESIRKTPMTDKEASEWWLSFVCGTSPLYSQIHSTVNGPSGGSPQSSRHQTIIQETLDYVTKQGPLAKLDMSLHTATKELEVIDPWSTAAAYMDPGVVTAAVRSACAAAMVHETESTTNNLVTTNGDTVSTSTEDLLNMSTELAAAPPLDYYATNGITLSEDELSLRRLVGNTDTKTNRSLLTPAFATPAESITARVRIAYDAIHRRLAAESIHNEPGSMATLTREVAARKIQRTWRGSNIIRIARRELQRRKLRMEQAAANRGAAMTAAISQFMAALEASTGVELGSSVLAEQLSQLTNSGIYGKSSSQNRDIASLLSSSSSVAKNSWKTGPTIKTNTGVGTMNYSLPPRPETAPQSVLHMNSNNTRIHNNSGGGNGSGSSTSTIVTRPRTSSGGNGSFVGGNTGNSSSNVPGGNSYLRYTEVNSNGNSTNGNRSQRNSLTGKSTNIHHIVNPSEDLMNLPTVSVNKH